MVHSFSSRLFYRVVFFCFCLVFTCLYLRRGSGNDQRDNKTEPRKLKGFIDKLLNDDVFVEHVLNLTENGYVNGNDTKREIDFSTTTRKETVATPPRIARRVLYDRTSSHLSSILEAQFQGVNTVSFSRHSNGGRDTSNKKLQQSDFEGNTNRKKFASFATQQRQNGHDVEALSKTKMTSTECANFTSTIKYEGEFRVWNNFSMKFRKRMYYYNEYRITDDGLEVCESSDSVIQRKWTNLLISEKKIMASKHCNVSVDGFYPENYTVYQNLTVFFKPTQQHFTRKDYGVILGYFLICSSKLSLSCHDYLVKVRYGEHYNVFNNFSLIYNKKMYNYREYRLAHDGLEMCPSSDARTQAIWKTRNSFEKFIGRISCNEYEFYLFNVLHYTINKQFTVYVAKNSQYLRRNDYFLTEGALIVCEEKLRSKISEYTADDLSMCNDSIIKIKNSDDYKVWDDFSMFYKSKVYDYTEYRVLNDSIKICNSTENFVRNIWKLRNIWVKRKMHYKSCNQPHVSVVARGFYTVLKDLSVRLKYNLILAKYDYGVFEGNLIICVEKLSNILRSFNTNRVAPMFCALAVSILSLLLLLMVYCMLPELRTLPGLNLMSLSLAFLLFFTCLVVFFCLILRAGKVLKLPCRELFVAGQFTTYNILINAAVNVYHLRKTFCGNTLVKSDENKWKSFLKYCLFSWGVPIIIAIVYTALVLTDALRFHLAFLRCVHNGPFWLTITETHIIPGCLLLCTTVMFILTAYRINQKLKASNSIAQKSHIVRTRKNFVLLLKLSTTSTTTILISLPTAFQIFPLALNIHLQLTVITVALLSGVYLGIAFVFTRKNYRLLKKKYFPAKNEQINNEANNKANKHENV